MLASTALMLLGVPLKRVLARIRKHGAALPPLPRLLPGDHGRRGRDSQPRLHSVQSWRGRGRGRDAEIGLAR
jgi:hypothetical protein